MDDGAAAIVAHGDQVEFSVVVHVEIAVLAGRERILAGGVLGAIPDFAIVIRVPVVQGHALEGGGVRRIVRRSRPRRSDRCSCRKPPRRWFRRRTVRWLRRSMSTGMCPDPNLPRWWPGRWDWNMPVSTVAGPLVGNRVAVGIDGSRAQFDRLIGFQVGGRGGEGQDQGSHVQLGRRAGGVDHLDADSHGLAFDDVGRRATLTHHLVAGKGRDAELLEAHRYDEQAEKVPSSALYSSSVSMLAGWTWMCTAVMSYLGVKARNLDQQVASLSLSTGLSCLTGQRHGHCQYQAHCIPLHGSDLLFMVHVFLVLSNLIKVRSRQIVHTGRAAMTTEFEMSSKVKHSMMRSQSRSPAKGQAEVGQPLALVLSGGLPAWFS